MQATLAALGLSLVLAAGPAAAETLRQFAGTVVSIGGGRITVENRMGDRQSFAGGSDTRVSGARSSWGEIREGDEVIVGWSLSDRPARALRIRVRGGD